MEIFLVLAGIALVILATGISISLIMCYDND